METSAEQQKLMRRYLLGAMPEGEMDALDGRMFTEPEIFDRMWEVENDLIDQYVRDGLSRTEREQFEHHYLSTPEHRDRVLTARRLVRLVDEESRKEATPPRRHSVAEFFRFPQWTLTAGLAAGLLLTGLWAGRALQERNRLRDELAIANARTAPVSNDQTAEKLLADERLRNEQLNQELEKLRAQTPAGGTSPPSAQPASISFLLSSRLVRDEGNRMQELKIPADVGLVKLQLPFPTNDYKRCQVAIRNIDAGEVWRQSGLRVQAGSPTSAVTAGVPAAKLAPGDYILTLSGQTSAGEPEEIERYSFRILKGSPSKR
jgi:hypothetical protein